jgi:hypothetical protein
MISDWLIEDSIARLRDCKIDVIVRQAFARSGNRDNVPIESIDRQSNNQPSIFNLQSQHLKWN